VKLLFDHNLSFKLVDRLSDLYPDSNHVYKLGLDKVDDTDIWEYAQANDFIIVTKDADFSDLCLLQGFPPKVVWIRRGNCNEARNRFAHGSRSDQRGGRHQSWNEVAGEHCAAFVVDLIRRIK
jgi:predicted nuclease of predicted toxin-antitoxin system